MTTATRPRSLGHRLAAKLPKPSRRGASADARRPRPRRPRISPKFGENSRSRSTQRDAEAKRLLKTIRIRNAEQALEQSHVGRHLLQLTDRRSRALFKEGFARLTLHAVQRAAERARAAHSRACGQLRYREFEQVHFKLKTAEARERKASQLHAAAVEAREMVDCQLRTLERTVFQGRQGFLP